MFSAALQKGIQTSSWFALALAAVCTLVVLGNNLSQGAVGIPVHAWMYFFAALLLGWFSRSLGLSIVIFLLPLTPTINQQFAAILPLLEVKRTLSGFDLIAGFVVGTVVRYLTLPTQGRTSWALPPTISLACIVLTISVVLAIARNLWQAASVFSFAGLKYNALHLSSIGWRDDYYPLVDFFSYGLAIAFIACVLQILGEDERPEDTVLKPLLWGVIVSALWSVLQSKTGLGLPHSSASGNRYYQGFGFAGTGFQPDIHAFSGHMLLGVVGACGCYFLKDTKISRWLITAAILMGIVGLAVSKSRGSALLACMFYLMLAGWWLWRRDKAYVFMATTAIFFGMGAVYIFHRWGMSIIPLWFIQYIESLPRLHIHNLEALNAHFGHRAEIYRAAIRMFESFPLMGLGLGTFYRMSGTLEFSGSKFLAAINGENAHNYFLQILAETGVVGFIVFAAVIIVPVLRAKGSRRLLPVGTMLIAFGLGNIFAHSLLIRENFFLFAACIAVLYVKAQRIVDSAQNIQINPLHEDIKAHHIKFQHLSRWALPLSLILVLLIVREVYVSFGKFPYLYGARCYAPTELKTDDWTTGMFVLNVPADAKGVILNIRESQPFLKGVPLSLEVSAKTPDASEKLKTLRNELGPVSPQSIVVSFEDFGSKTLRQLIFTTSRCFTPKNLGVNADPRRMGIVVQEIVWLKN
ncbi:O-antigen ligase family protein [Zwartia vadi]|uniref:O-antigen ligase family protein n=1 Tax=Zwartia vadi TaxID=3058168 RepID=UPI0025B2E417|nr:O-antigen ligase family protein [Zwartia vadi]MDN3988230.1 O-antigen ligase family protein [Zwartia vadi]